MKRGCDQSQVNRLADVLETGANRKAADFIEHAETILKGITALFAVLLVISSAAAFYQLKEIGLLEQTIFLGVGFFVCLGGYLRIQAEYVSKVRAGNID